MPETVLQGALRTGRLISRREGTSTVNLLEVQDANGNILFYVSASGLVGFQGQTVFLAVPISSTAGVPNLAFTTSGSGIIDLQKAIGNSTAANNGNVAVDAADDIEMLGNQKGLIIRTSTGARYRINVSDAGQVQATAL